MAKLLLKTSPDIFQGDLNDTFPYNFYTNLTSLEANPLRNDRKRVRTFSERWSSFVLEFLTGLAGLRETNGGGGSCGLQGVPGV